MSNLNAKNIVGTTGAALAFLILGMFASTVINPVETFRITGKIEEVKSFQVGEDFKFLLKLRVSSSDDERFANESITIINAHDSRINALVDNSKKECTSEGVIVCSYPVTHKENITLVVREELGSNNLPELEGSIQ